MAIRFEDTKAGAPAPKAKGEPARPPVADQEAGTDVDAKLAFPKSGKPAKPERRGKGR